MIAGRKEETPGGTGGFSGAGNGIRTRDIQLGRLMLYQLSYPRTPAAALRRPNEDDLVEGEGFEPSKAVAVRFTV